MARMTQEILDLSRMMRTRSLVYKIILVPSLMKLLIKADLCCLRGGGSSDRPSLNELRADIRDRLSL